MNKTMLIFALALLLPVNANAESIEGGDLITCVETDAVYYYGEDGNRYVFQNEQAYFSWEDDFEDVVTVDCDDLSELSLAGIVPYQAGTQLVKIPSVPTVYTVEPNGTLRAIPDEETAEELYGEDWASLVDDLDESFFPQYELGEPLEEDELPEGMILKDEEGNYYRVDEDGTAIEANDLIGDGSATRLDDTAIDMQRLKTDIIDRLAYLMSEDEAFAEKIAQIMEEHHFVDIPKDQERDDLPQFEKLTDEEIQEKTEEIMSRDSDGDGLSDREEQDVWGTDPNNADSDGDGFSDGDELLHGYNPLGEGTLDNHEEKDEDELEPLHDDQGEGDEQKEEQIDEPLDEPVNDTEEPKDEPTNEPIGEPMDDDMQDEKDEPVNEPIGDEEPLEDGADIQEPIDDHMDEPIDKSPDLNLYINLQSYGDLTVSNWGDTYDYTGFVLTDEAGAFSYTFSGTFAAGASMDISAQALLDYDTTDNSMSLYDATGNWVSTWSSY